MFRLSFSMITVERHLETHKKKKIQIFFKAVFENFREFVNLKLYLV